MAVNKPTKRGMVLHFQPLSLAFDHVNYYVDMPAVSPLCVFIQHAALPYDKILKLLAFKENN